MRNILEVDMLPLHHLEGTQVLIGFLHLQQVYINPRPVSAGLQIEGVDITTNGRLNGIPLEPPNPAICVGNGFVMEVTNDVRFHFLLDS